MPWWGILLIILAVVGIGLFVLYRFGKNLQDKQVSQKEHGKATIYYVPLPGVDIDDPSSLFDSNNVAIDFEFKKIGAPLRTKAGKVLLLVSNSVVEEAFEN